MVFPKIDEKSKTIEGVNINTLILRFGAPLFVASEKILRQKYRFLKSALQKYYPNFQIAYSYKTNYLLGICFLFKQEGALAEVTSDFEYDIATRINYLPKDIVFNGPYKTDEYLKKAIVGGCRLNADNVYEIARIESVAKSCGRKAKIGIRVNANIGFLPWNRFGFNIESDEAYNIFKTIKNNCKNIDIVGVHMHIGTNINRLSFYKKAADLTSDLINRVTRDFNFKIKYLDLGGGFASEGARPLEEKDWKVPSIERYISSIAEILNKKLVGSKPLLILEPGRFLVDEAFVLIARVITTRYIKGVRSVTVDASLNILPSAYTREHPIRVIKGKQEDKKKELTDIYGISCMQADLIESGKQLPSLREGDILVFYNAGAYSIVLSNQFIHPRPAVIIIGKNKKVGVLRKKEATSDILHLDKIPKFLEQQKRKL